MGLPASYKLPSIPTAAYNLIGDSVVPPVIGFLAQQILEPVLRAQRDPAADAAKPIAAQ